ncbi:hypothetical protein AcW1_000975 [Taiwanofungus camphoratus]|nr:hypothetical protein AcV5_004878 [Antrodia cinnamomea]KAI0962063.1 hypothetical protein AcV7_000986 [Antrodia cinnamomea]KAI0964070.1 hypothetical protein AcW1_000975 [Antrodia cinnamomea]
MPRSRPTTSDLRQADSHGKSRKRNALLGYKFYKKVRNLCQISFILNKDRRIFTPGSNSCSGRQQMELMSRYMKQWADARKWSFIYLDIRRLNDLKSGLVMFNADVFEGVPLLQLSLDLDASDHLWIECVEPFD